MMNLRNTYKTIRNIGIAVAVGLLTYDSNPEKQMGNRLADRPVVDKSVDYTGLVRSPELVRWEEEERAAVIATKLSFMRPSEDNSRAEKGEN